MVVQSIGGSAMRKLWLKSMEWCPVGLMRFNLQLYIDI